MESPGGGGDSVVSEGYKFNTYPFVEGKSFTIKIREGVKATAGGLTSFTTESNK